MRNVPASGCRAAHPVASPLSRGRGPVSELSWGRGGGGGLQEHHGLTICFNDLLSLPRHYPKQSFTMVADTPENLRLKQQSELQSQVSALVVPQRPCTAILGLGSSSRVSHI